MLILTIRTDKLTAEIGLFDGNTKLACSTWLAHRQLAETIHLKIQELLESQSRTLQDLKSIIIFKGPGSFTGLRIGFSVANALAYSLQIPIVAENRNNWIKAGLSYLKADSTERLVMPEYGSPLHITPSRK